MGVKRILNQFQSTGIQKDICLRFNSPNVSHASE